MKDINLNSTRVENYIQRNKRDKLLNGWEKRGKFIFLSHSHKDKDIIKPVIAFLRMSGINVYVDWLDETMPKFTSRETAEKIQRKIKECDEFIVLLTENSKESKWVPWELGYSDGVKSLNKISILPIKRDLATKDSDFTGVEYMHLYKVYKLEDLYTEKRLKKVDIWKPVFT